MVNETKANVADEADEVYEVVVVAVETLLLLLLLVVVVAVETLSLSLVLPFSLTKYSAIFLEVKESFEVNNNQLGLGFDVWQQRI